MINTWNENRIDFADSNDFKLYYCGVRDKSLNHKYGPYCMEHYLINYIYGGKAEFEFEGKTAVFGEGQLYVMFPESSMSYETFENVPWSIQWIIVSGKEVERILSELGITSQNPAFTVKNKQRTKQIFDEIFLYSSNNSTPGCLKCISLVYELFASLYDNVVKTKNTYISEALEYIQKHLDEEITVSDIAKVLHLNSNYFSKLFKSQTGITPLKAINQLKIEQAQKLLKSTNIPISEISRSIGIKDPLYFSRMFRKHCGFSPMSYRNLTKI